MKILAFDTSTNISTVALIEDSNMLAEFNLAVKKTHSKTLMPIIDDILKYTEVKLKDIDVLAVCSGPGSFTGLRIGITTAKTIAQTLNIPIIEVSALDSLAHNIAHINGIICPIIDAKRNEVYTAIYKVNEDKIEKVLEDNVINIKDLIGKLKEYGDNVYFLGDGVNVHEEYIVENMDNAKIVKLNNNSSRALSLATVAREYSESKHHYEVTATYIRKAQAEEQKDDKNSK